MRAAASTVRQATTESGEIPRLMASLPKTGVKPRQTAEARAARIPAPRCWSLMRKPMRADPLADQCLDFLQELIAEEVAFLHQCLDVRAQLGLLVRGQLLGR